MTRRKAKLAERRAKLSGGDVIRCGRCLQQITSPDGAGEKHGALVDAGDCERQWGSDELADDPETAG